MILIHIFIYASKRLKDDYDFVLYSVKKDGNIICYVSKNIRNDPIIMKIAVVQNVLNIKFISKSLFDNKKFIKEIIEERPSVYSFLPLHLQYEDEYIFLSLQKYIYNYNYIPSKKKIIFDIF